MTDTVTPTATFHPTSGFDGTFTIGHRAGLSHGQAWHHLRTVGLTAAEADRALADARRR
jgi:hypothetical protein